MCKKNIGLILFSALFLIFAISFANYASAQTFGDSIDSIAVGMQGGIRLLFGDVTGISSASPGEILFIKLLVFILLFATIDLTLKRIPTFGDNRGIALLISVVVALIAVRYITTEQLINFIWLPYGVLGIVFSVALPFIIGFFFIESFDSSIIRKVGWAIYFVIFAGLAYMRWDTMQTGAWYQNLAWMYLAIAILSGLLILFDKQIKTMMFMSSLKGVEDVNKRVEAARLTAQIEEDRNFLAQTTDLASRRALEQRIKQRKKTLKAIMAS